VRNIIFPEEENYQAESSIHQEKLELKLKQKEKLTNVVEESSRQKLTSRNLSNDYIMNNDDLDQLIMNDFCAMLYFLYGDQAEFLNIDNFFEKSKNEFLGLMIIIDDFVTYLMNVPKEPNYEELNLYVKKLNEKIFFEPKTMSIREYTNYLIQEKMKKTHTSNTDIINRDVKEVSKRNISSESFEVSLNENANQHIMKKIKVGSDSNSSSNSNDAICTYSNNAKNTNHALYYQTIVGIIASESNINPNHNPKEIFDSISETIINEEIKFPLKCIICLEKNIVDPYQLFISSNCSDHCICLDCMNGYLSSEINGNNSEIRCPGAECQKIISFNEVEIFLKMMQKMDLLEKYNQLVLERTLNHMKNAKQCPKCNIRFIINPGDTVVRCPNDPECKFVWCVNCNQEHNPQNTCEQFIEWMKLNRKADYESYKWAERQTKLCPKCETPIEKNQGCDHMKCTKCNTDFSWEKAKSFHSTIVTNE
jgi:hypothetical protein